MWQYGEYSPQSFTVILTWVDMCYLSVNLITHRKVFY